MLLLGFTVFVHADRTANGVPGDGVLGNVLQSLGGSESIWVATSSLGISGGSASATGTVGQIQFTDGLGNFQASTATTSASGNINLPALGQLLLNGIKLAFGSSTLSTYFFGESGNTTQTATFNTGAGYQSLLNVTTGGSNSAFGKYASRSNTEGTNNVAIGAEALYSNATGTHNTGVGDGAGFFMSGGLSNTLIGQDAGQGASGQSNYSSVVAVGRKAGNALTTGGLNTFVGTFAGNGFTTGANNTSIGYQAMAGNLIGNNNVALGYFAGRYETASNTLYVDNQNRTNTAGDKAKALLYGTFDANETLQTLNINASTSLFSLFNKGFYRDSTNASGTVGQVLWSTGTSTLWVATSSLGISGGSGITSLNGLTGASQTFTAQASTTATTFVITSSGTGHTFDIPDAGTSARGFVSTTTQTIAGAKTFSSSVLASGILGVGGISAGGAEAFISSGSSAGSQSTSQSYALGGSATTWYRVGLGFLSYGGSFTANNPVAKVIIPSGTITEAGSGNHPLFAQLAVKPFTISSAAATVSNTASTYIEGAATTTTVSGENYSLWVDNVGGGGKTRIDGTLTATSGAISLATTTVTGNLSLTGAFIPRVVGYTSSSTITLNVDTTDEATTTVNQTTTFANPVGTPINGVMYMFTLTATTTQTISWGTLYASSTDLSYPTSIASGTTEVLWKYDSWKGKYLLLGLLKTFQ